ncbi:MAG: DUF1702 family protein [Saprospiraceae bacterium]|nr:DUF1702 family protein [Saprospiraceae bacterium]
MLESELQLREHLYSFFPTLKPLPENMEKPIEGLGLARRSFVSGYHEALKTKRAELPFLFQNEDPNAAGFMLEGAGMALTILDEKNNSDVKYLPMLFSGRPDSDLKLCSIGVGWASARLSKPVNWIPVGISKEWAPSIANGYGFHQGFFNPEQFQNPNYFVVDDESMEHFDIGLGRALWFIHNGEVEPIVAVLNNFKPSRQPSMWNGIGIACVFNRDFGKKPELIKHSAGNEAHLMSGFEKAAILKQELTVSSQIISW